MFKKSIFPLIFIFTVVFLNASVAHSQQGKVTVFEDEKITELLALKSKMNKENKFTDGFTIQLYYGELTGANTIIKNYRNNFTSWPSTIIYETPNYKVWAGNFITRLEADRALLEIHKQFPNAFVFKPERRN
ncbi:MAG: translation initiation factor IF-2 [Bacteroidetes bacterium HGW-Bacteroidetes-2]|jgi:hypothetical protein|nr:MAG: translation initiation factor IF-2 [Bacteroidetes bacterium HGW-Bacteroidetes-2]